MVNFLPLKLQMAELTVPSVAWSIELFAIGIIGGKTSGIVFRAESVKFYITI